MRVVQYYSHLNGYEWMQFHKPALWSEVVDTIASIDASAHRTKISEEKTMAGKLLFSPKTLNKDFGTRLKRLGWAESRMSYWITDDETLIRRTMTQSPAQQKQAITDAGKIPIYSYNQTDFKKERVAIELQLGKYSFVAYDLFVKHLAFYVGDQIDLGIEILPMKSMKAEMSSGPGYFESALYDVVRQGRGVPAVPLILVGIDHDPSVSISASGST